MKKENIRPIQNPKRYLLALIIGTLIFITGFLLTNIVSQYQFQRISNFQDETSYEIFKDKLLTRFFDKEICSNNVFSEISEDLAFQGAIIGDLETKFGKNNKRVIFRKKFYTVVLTEHFEFVKDLNKECDTNITTIIFFYSNKKDDLSKSEGIGRILDTLHTKNPKIMIYSFDINLDSEIIRNLVKKYNIEKSPTLIINENKKIFNPKNINEIENYLGIKSDVIYL